MIWDFTTEIIIKGEVDYTLGDFEEDNQNVHVIPKIYIGGL